jgi:hypothetical protein
VVLQKPKTLRILTVPTPDVQPEQSLLARSNILHEPLKLGIIPNQSSSDLEQPLNLFVGKIQRGRNLHQRARSSGSAISARLALMK